jgi:hypothetical protein
MKFSRRNLLFAIIKVVSRKCFRGNATFYQFFERPLFPEADGRITVTDLERGAAFGQKRSFLIIQ